MSIYIGGPTTIVISDMQGPCPDGFHVPLSSEWEGIGGLKTIMSGLGLTTGDSWRINLHMPFAGKRLPSNSAISNQGSRGYYWSSSPYDSGYNSRDLLMESSGVYENSSYPRANGFSIRCFKNSFVAPDSSWTVVQGTLGSAGIFWNQTEGLISITSDGTTGYTIQDKNLGATTVYNDGDTLSESNCGKYYQWGNNYGFSRTGSVTTSSTIVNAGSYGPGNYYESSTFIVNSSYDGYWDSSNNGNLRGGVSQGTSTKTEYQEVQNIYIGEYKWSIVDFTTATAASLQADGFTTYGNLGLDSNGMYVSSGDNAGCGVYKAVDLTGCSKFTLKFYSSLTSGSWAGGPNLGIGALSGSSFTSPYSWLNFRSNSNSGYCGEQLFYENSIIAQNTTAKSNGDYTTTIVYDFSNSTVSVTTTGPTPASYSASLSSAQVTALTQNRYVKFEIAVGGWSAGKYNRLKKVERIIE